MANNSKNSKPEKHKDFPRKVVPCPSGPSVDEQGRSYADLITSPEFAAYRIVGMMQPKHLSEDIDVPTMLEALRDQAKAVQADDMDRAEAMLMNQATALQALFVRLSERAAEQSNMQHIEGFMRLALRAQSQCRATLETLAHIKNPPIVYAKQANVTTGPQQVNNGVATPSRARENEISPNQLSGDTYELLPNARTPSLASRIDPSLEAVGEIDRTEVQGR